MQNLLQGNPPFVEEQVSHLDENEARFPLHIPMLLSDLNIDEHTDLSSPRRFAFHTKEQSWATAEQSRAGRRAKDKRRSNSRGLGCFSLVGLQFLSTFDFHSAINNAVRSQRLQALHFHDDDLQSAERMHEGRTKQDQTQPASSDPEGCPQEVLSSLFPLHRRSRKEKREAIFTGS